MHSHSEGPEMWLSASSRTTVRKGAYANVIWVHADAIWVLEHPYTTPVKTTHGFRNTIRDAKEPCKIFLRPNGYHNFRPEGPYVTRMIVYESSMGQNDRKIKIKN